MIIPLFSGTIFLSSCKRNYVALDFTNAKGEVPPLSNLVFRFNKSLYPDSLLNNWDSTEYISFSPKISGRFRWNGPDELVFSPSQPLSPATSYKATINDDVVLSAAAGEPGRRHLPRSRTPERLRREFERGDANHPGEAVPDPIERSQ